VGRTLRARAQPRYCAGVALLVLGIVFLLFLSVYGGVSGIAGGIGLILLGHVNMSGATRRAIDEIEQSGNEVETAPPTPVS
jgi:small neutral amino acid transporter SnatA (MarC family)